MTRDELIAALQKCPENVEVLIDDPEYGIPSIIDTVGVAAPEFDGVTPDDALTGKIIINLIGDEYVVGTRSQAA